MQHSQISRKIANAFLALVAIGGMAACADSASAPAPEVAAFKAPASFTTVEGVVTFTVNNSEGRIQRVGDHVIAFPAGAICDPLFSGYGSTEWDKPCTSLRGSMVITATMLRNSENQPYVDFQPALRFAPTKEVLLFLRNGRSSRATQLSVLYCNNLGFCRDESLTDSSLKPFRVGNTSIIGRRIKHFSGYMIAAGEPCNGTITQEPDGTWMCYEDGMTRRSGYMVASGNDEKATPKEEEKDGKTSADWQK